MTDIFLRAGETNPADIRLRDPTIPDGGGVTQKAAEVTWTGVASLLPTYIRVRLNNETFQGVALLQPIYTRLRLEEQVIAGAAVLLLTSTRLRLEDGVLGGVATISASGLVVSSAPAPTLRGGGGVGYPRQRMTRWWWQTPKQPKEEEDEDEAAVPIIRVAPRLPPVPSEWPQEEPVEEPALALAKAAPDWLLAAVVAIDDQEWG